MSTNLNDGKVHTFDEIKQSGLVEAAKMFAEGNEALESILLNLWEQDIETTACCIGRYEKHHQNEQYKIFKKPYVTIKITNDNLSKVMMLIKYILESNNDCKPNIRFDRYDYNSSDEFGYITSSHHTSLLTLERTFMSKQSAKNMFTCILDCVNNLKNNKQLNVDNSSVALETIEELAQREIINPSIHNVEVYINSKNLNSQFSFGTLGTKLFKSKLNNETVELIKKKYTRFTQKSQQQKKEVQALSNEFDDSLSI